MAHTLASRINVLRRRHRTPKAALATILGCSLRAMRDWERGLGAPSPAQRVVLVYLEQHPERFHELLAAAMTDQAEADERGAGLRASLGGA